MADEQATADVQSPAPAGSDSPVLAAFNKKAKELRDKQGSQVLDAFNSKVKSLRGKQDSQLLDIFNNKLATVRASQPEPQPETPQSIQAAHPSTEMGTISSWTPSWWDRIKGTVRNGYVGRNLGYGPSLTRDEHAAYDSLTTPQKIAYDEAQQKAEAVRRNDGQLSAAHGREPTRPVRTAGDGL